MHSDVYIEDLLAPNYDALLEDVLAHRHSQYMLKGGRGSLKSSFTGFVIPLIMLEHKANSRVYVQRFFLRQYKTGGVSSGSGSRSGQFPERWQGSPVVLAFAAADNRCRCVSSRPLKRFLR